MKNKDSLAAAVTTFEQWRNMLTQPNTHTPDTLCQQAVALMSDYPISKIISALKLPHSSLKRWSGKMTPDSEAVTVVALPDITESSSSKLNLALSFNSGCQMRLDGVISSALLTSLAMYQLSVAIYSHYSWATFRLCNEHL